MKTLKIHLGEKMYTSGKITAWASRKAVEINREAIALSKMPKELAETEDATEAVGRMFDAIDDIATRKANLICEVYGNRFTPDELEKALSTDEIDAQITEIVAGATGIMAKN